MAAVGTVCHERQRAADEEHDMAATAAVFLAA